MCWVVLLTLPKDPVEQRQKPPCEGFIMVLSSKTFAKGKSWGAKGLRKVRESCVLYGVCERARERF